jgi:adenosylmethionine-8-amino-7-oxononanoate aminotransferase
MPSPDPIPTGPVATTGLLATDRDRVWHPYAPMPGTNAPLAVASASGVRLRLAPPAHPGHPGHPAQGGRDGHPGQQELIDAMSSWWAAIHGYRHPVLDEAARTQLGRMSHVMFGGLTHEPAVRLCDRLATLAPDGLEHVFLCDSGSVSVEVAIKMALQYWRSRGRPAKRRLLTWRGGYHGDTFWAMSVCDPGGGMHKIWDGVLPEQVFAGLPPAGFAAGVDPGYAGHLATLIEQHAGELAAVIVEPVVQGAGGMRFHDPGYLRVLRDACDQHGVLLRPQRGAVRRRSRRGQPGRDVRRQGADRRLPDPGRRLVHPGRGRGDFPGRAARTGPRPHLHG